MNLKTVLITSFLTTLIILFLVACTFNNPGIKGENLDRFGGHLGKDSQTWHRRQKLREVQFDTEVEQMHIELCIEHLKYC